MKALFYVSYFLLAGLLFFSACQSDSSGGSAEEEAEVENVDHSKTLVVPWVVVQNDSTGMMEIRREPAADMTNLGPHDIIDALNLKYPAIQLEWVEQTGNKCFVRINEAEYLTQQLGNEGSRAYLAEATFSLTELEGIEAVDFSFKEGDHARPGVYTRKDFENFN
jgi:hypothetical protein